MMDNAILYGEAIRVAEVNRVKRVELIRLVVPYLLAAALVAFSLFLFLWTRVSVITLNYEIANLTEQQQMLARENRELTIQLDTVTSPENLETMGKEKFGLIYPDSSSVIPIR
jgi:cell division protein FtsL